MWYSWIRTFQIVVPGPGRVTQTLLEALLNRNKIKEDGRKPPPFPRILTK